VLHPALPAVVEGGLGDLGDRGLGVVLQRDPRRLVDRLDRRSDVGLQADTDRDCQPARSSRSNTVLFQKPLSARSSFSPRPPARSMRAISSSQKRPIPREVLADPVRNRMCNTSPASARTARIG
jgi:hypothetical protein